MKGKIWLIFVLVVALSAGFLMPALADEEKEDLNFQLEQVVVTATKTLKQVKDAPATVEVTTAEDMKKQNVKRISDQRCFFSFVWF